MEYVQAICDIGTSTIRNFGSLDEKMRRLKRKLETLESREDDINDELTYAESLSLKKRRKSVETWLTNVERVKKEVQLIANEVRERKWYEFLKLQTNIERSTTEVEELIHHGRFSGGLTLEVNNENHVVSLLTPELVGQMFQKDKSTILECISSGTVSIIGIYGMGGVGKTTLVSHIYNELINYPNTSVSWVTVSKNCSSFKLQSDIAKRINLKFSDLDDEIGRAAILADAIKGRNNYVLILDDVWDHISLETVGIPIAGNSCKLIITTRSLDICRSMNCQKEVKVKPLPNEEAWKLFTKTLGLDTELSLECEEIAKSLVKECDGLPLGIVTMAGSMRGVEDKHEWSNALEKMRESNLQHEDSEFDKVFGVLRYSFDKLKDHKIQECFLYCSLFPEDHRIDRDELIEYFIDERLIDGRKSRQMEISRGHTILNKLENVCLLEGGKSFNGKRYVKMHDLVRDMAIQIVSATPRRFLVEAGVKLKNLLAEENWTNDLVRVSLMDNEISNIPLNASPRSPRLQTLLLRQNLKLDSIPNCFFVHMDGLAVLDLSYTSVTCLPGSISNLRSLIALLLHNCSSLKYVPSLSNLKTLRRLDFFRTKITEVPEGMEALTNLRYLNLGVKKLEIPNGILARFSHLQHLVVHDLESSTCPVRLNEIMSLNKLETFKGQLYNIGDLNKYVQSWEESGLNGYLLQVGVFLKDWRTQHFLKEYNKGYDKIARIKYCNISESRSGEDSLFLPKDVRSLHIRCCPDVTCLCDVASLKNATDLTICSVEECDEMKHLLCSSCCRLPVFERLESVYVWNLFKLTTLVGGERGVVSFSYLKNLNIKKCPNMKWLFMPALVSNLRNLESLRVQDCEEMVDILGEASDEDQDREATSADILTFPKLTSLTLMQLPELKSFCYNKKAIASDPLHTIVIYSCPKLKRIPLLKEDLCPPPSLQRIHAEKSWWDSLEWDHPDTKTALQPFCELT
ncbi:NB-ARC domain, LRR domain containing protein [Parasponia andersonii]|uniref:NB-ARC domain, LRR domain containing protein n=1 Tax=Parasponia andersonii TaxID=3476 RepID=A0A2P5CDW5_PARAD|nr:NB-ARC domain, LRR domain containing protein [Parasponia andersonii]